MDVIVKFGTPYLLSGPIMAILFLLLPAALAAAGAFLLQGSYLRILGAAIGGAGRDVCLLLLAVTGTITPDNPYWLPDFSITLAFFGAAGAALGSCLAPYRGKLLLCNAAVGGFLGQFLLPFLVRKLSNKPRKEASLH